MLFGVLIVHLRRASVKALVRWATGKRLTNRLPKLSLITLPPFEQRDSWSSYGAVGAYSEVLHDLWGSREMIYQILDMEKFTFL